YIRFDNNGKVSGLGQGELYIRNVMITASSTAPTYHNKESRCDLICLRNDGQVMVTQGTGSSELGYRVEAEDGSISTWYRDKRTVRNWDRAKVVKSGTGWTTFVSNETSANSLNANDTLTISFVGTG